MSKNQESPRPCAVCGRSFAPRDLVSSGLVHDRVSEEIRAEHPQWSQESFICRPDLSHFRAQHVRSMLESEKGELSALDQRVLTSLRGHEVLAKNIEAELEIRHLHEKIDHLLTHQWERLFEIQEIQIELLQDMGRRA